MPILPRSSLTILGLDPGLQRTGWGVIEIQGNRLIYLGHGVIQTSASAPMAERLSQLFQGLCSVLDTHHPTEAAVEETFVNSNATSTLKLGMARGVVLMAPASRGIHVGEYATNRVKKAVVGAGHATKDQVSIMVQRLLTHCPPVTSDAADALAVAICHGHFRTSAMKFSI